MRNPAPLVNPRDPILGPLKGFLDWVHRRLDAELPPMATATALWNPGNLADGQGESTTVTVRGASVGDPVMVGFSVRLTDGVQFTGQVVATDTVKVLVVNHTGGAYNAPVGTVRVCVWRFGT